MVCPNCGREIIIEQGRRKSCGTYFTPKLLKISHGIKGAYELTKVKFEKVANTHIKLLSMFF